MQVGVRLMVLELSVHEIEVLIASPTIVNSLLELGLDWSDDYFGEIWRDHLRRLEWRHSLKRWRACKSCIEALLGYS